MSSESTIRHPLLHGLRLSEGWEPSVKFLPPLFSEQVFYLSVRSSGQRPITAHFQIQDEMRHTIEDFAKKHLKPWLFNRVARKIFSHFSNKHACFLYVDEKPFSNLSNCNNKNIEKSKCVWLK